MKRLNIRPAVAGAFVAASATLFVAATAFRLAYAGSKGAATDAGLMPSDASWYPLCIEGVLVVAAVATVVLGGPYPWLVLLGFSALSIGANVQHAVDQPGQADWFMLMVAAVPPFALPLCVELTIRTVKKLTIRPIELAAVVAPDLDTAPTGQGESAPALPARPDQDTTLAPPGVVSVDTGRGVLLPATPGRPDPDERVMDHSHGPVGQPTEPVHSVDQTVTPDPSVDRSTADHPLTQPVGQVDHKGSTTCAGHGPVHVDHLPDLTGVTDPAQRVTLIRDHHLLDRTIPDLADLFGVSRSTAKRDRANARRAATTLRAVR